MKQNITEALSSLDTFLFDMDGTIYLGDQLFPGVIELFKKLKDTGKKFLFFTNNSSKNKKSYQIKLSKLGLDVDESHILTSGEATCRYLKKEFQFSKIYLLGTPLLEEEFTEFGFQLTDKEPEAIVLGFDMNITYDKIKTASELILNKTPYFATHPDLVCPTLTGSIPDTGSFIEMFYAATQKRPVVIGKPNKIMPLMAMDKLNSQLETSCIIGDRLYTDMEMGFRLGIKTFLVLSGEATLKDVENSEKKPDFIIESVKDLLENLK